MVIDCHMIFIYLFQMIHSSREMGDHERDKAVVILNDNTSSSNV